MDQSVQRNRPIFKRSVFSTVNTPFSTTKKYFSFLLMHNFWHLCVHTLSEGVSLIVSDSTVRDNPGCSAFYYFSSCACPLTPLHVHRYYYYFQYNRTVHGTLRIGQPTLPTRAPKRTPCLGEHLDKFARGKSGA